MTEAEFLAAIREIYDDGREVIGFIFDNSGRAWFGLSGMVNSFDDSQPEFVLDKVYNSTTHCIEGWSYDSKGLKYYWGKPRACIQTILSTDKGHRSYEYDTCNMN